MKKKDLLTILQNQTNIIWDNLCEMYSPLTSFNPPIIELNGRLYRTAGRCHQEDNVIQLGTKFLTHSIEYRDIMTEIILPHEIIHQADYNLFGLSEAKCGHGKKWQEIMINYGLEPNPFHSMEIKR
jgi:predicted SprT family Zn-dependent metalloprotease